jgi:hypothetical protein
MNVFKSIKRGLFEATAGFGPKDLDMIPKLQFNSETKVIDIIKTLKDCYTPNSHEIFIKVGKKSFALLEYKDN